MMPDAKDTDWTVAANEAKSEVLIFATWAGTHTVGDSPAGGGPTGKSTSTHFVYKGYTSYEIKEEGGDWPALPDPERNVGKSGAMSWPLRRPHPRHVWRGPE